VTEWNSICINTFTAFRALLQLLNKELNGETEASAAVASLLS
jgi:hypothetical protein